MEGKGSFARAQAVDKNLQPLRNNMSIGKTIALLLAAGALAVTQSVQGQIVLIEQTVNFHLKLTTMKTPVVNTTLTSFSAKLSNFSATVTTGDILRTLGFDPAAKVIVRLVVMTNVSPAVVSPQVVVKQGGAETDVTATLGRLIPTNNPMADLQQGLFGSGVVKGNAKGSLLQNSVSAALQAQTYEQLGVQLANFRAGDIVVGGLDFNAAGWTKSIVTLSGSLAGVNLRVSTRTQVTGGAIISQPSIFPSVDKLPAIIQGTITSQGVSHISTLSLPDFIDLTSLFGS
jgi:hypothetical protein